MILARLTELFGRLPLCGLALRWWANQFKEGSVVRIRQGYALGYVWKRHHRYVNGYWIGHYELAIQEALVRELRPGQIFYDIGANAGFFTLLGARLVGPVGKCIAFDPEPSNYQSIVELIALNDLKQCQVVREAVSEREGKEKFRLGWPGDSTGHLGGAGKGELEVEVKVTTLDEAVKRFGVPSVIKMDIEGAEVMALKGAQKLLSKGRSRWLIELHGKQCAEQVKAIMTEAKYCFYGINGSPIGDGESLPRHVLVGPIAEAQDKSQ